MDVLPLPDAVSQFIQALRALPSFVEAAELASTAIYAKVENVPPPQLSRLPLELPAGFLARLRRSGT